MFSQIFSFLKFLYRSTNHHGVHSPFVFDLLTKCLYTKGISKKFTTFNEFSKALHKNNQWIEITEYGAGSRVFSSNKRLVSKIAKHAGISRKRAKLLFKLNQYFQFASVLEMGTSLGKATCALSLGNSKSQIVTLEGCLATAQIAQSMFKTFDLDNIKLVQGDFNQTFLKEVKKQQFDCIYFDGNHTKEATLNYFRTCLPYLHNDSMLIFDDIHWSKQMEEAWQEIQEDENVTVTIDTYQWGFAFLRKEQQKEHFIIRV